MYPKKNWVDEVVDASTGEVIQRGTPQSAANFNNIENGIFDANIAASLLVISASQILSEQSVEIRNVSLTNTAKYPFNNSTDTVSISTRSNTNYTVEAYVVSHSGEVGNIIVYDKMLNGFKVKYDGSAKNANLKLLIRGGF